jgi:flagella basal body P-ring formation protein FlgA
VIGLLILAQVLAAEPLPRGTVLEPAMLTAEAGTDLAPYVGQQLTRPVFAGKPIGAADLGARDLVGRQSPVTVAFTRGALRLTVPGRSLRAGGAGDEVDVLIEGRRRPVRGRVIGHGLVEVAR